MQSVIGIYVIYICMWHVNVHVHLISIGKLNLIQSPYVCAKLEHVFISKLGPGVDSRIEPINQIWISMQGH